MAPSRTVESEPRDRKRLLRNPIVSEIIVEGKTKGIARREAILNIQIGERVSSRSQLQIRGWRWSIDVHSRRWSPAQLAIGNPLRRYRFKLNRLGPFAFPSIVARQRLTLAIAAAILLCSTAITAFITSRIQARRTRGCRGRSGCVGSRRRPAVSMPP